MSTWLKIMSTALWLYRSVRFHSNWQLAAGNWLLTAKNVNLLRASNYELKNTVIIKTSVL